VADIDGGSDGGGDGGGDEVVTKGGLKTCQNSCEDQNNENLRYLCKGGDPPVEPLN
jgi:hypothetical protein